jgi:hypothetical protein
MERLRPDASANDIGLADQNVHINEIERQGSESRCGEFRRLKVLPTNVPDRLSFNGNQSMTVRGALANHREHRIRVAPPTCDVAPIEPDSKHGQVPTDIKWEKLYA